MEKYSIIVAHSGRQHSFKLASALKKADMLSYYCTTIYNKDSSLLMKAVKTLLSADNLKRANGRKNPDLADEDVIQFCEFSGLIEIFLARYDKTHRLYRWFQRLNANRFGKKVAKLAIKSNANAVIMYDANAYNCFRILKEKAPHIIRIQDVSSSARPYKKKIYDHEILNSGNLDLKLANEYLWDDKQLQRMQDEIDFSQYFLVPSHFVENSLLACNTLSSQIKVVPYGANVSSNLERKQPQNDRPIHFLFVGNVDYNKGILYLLETMTKFDSNIADLTITGAYDKNLWFIKKYINETNVHFTGRVTFDKMRKIYEDADVFVIDSFSEGLAQVGIEAMACGLPIICSTNSGVSDLVQDGREGFIISPGDTKSLYEKMQWFVENRTRILEMGTAARKVALSYTWDAYDQHVKQSIIEILETVSK